MLFGNKPERLLWNLVFVRMCIECKNEATQPRFFFTGFAIGVLYSAPQKLAVFFLVLNSTILPNGCPVMDFSFLVASALPE